MKLNQLLNAAALTIGLVLGQYVFVLGQSSAQTEISFEGLGMEHGTTDLADLEPLESQGLPADENGNYVILGLGGEFPEPQLPSQDSLEESETKLKIQLGILTIDTCGIQGTGVCFSIPLF